MIPVYDNIFISNEKKYLTECIDSGWISSEGPFVREFEKEFAKFVGRKYGVAVCNGTSALEIAISLLGLKKGEEVILPTFTIISCVLAVINSGAKPVFVDADSETWCLDPRQVENKITSKTKIIMPVHIYGHPCDMDLILKIARKYNLRIVEDAAEAHGAEYKRKKCGSFGEISCFSFYANKIISCGEGGMVLMDNKKLAEKARLLRNLGFGKKKRFLHQILAKNYRLSNLQAAVGLAQLKNIKKLIKIKREIAKKYTERLREIEALQLPIEKEWAKNVYWMYGIVVDERTGFSAEKLAQKLREKGIDTRPFFYPLHLQPELWKLGIKTREKFPVAERLARQGLYLPSGMGLKNWQIDKVSETLKKILKC